MGNKNDDRSDCEKFLNIAQLLEEDEAGNHQKFFINYHIERGVPCFEHLQSEKKFREFVKRKIERKEVPQELIHAIEAKIKALVSLS